MREILVINAYIQYMSSSPQQIIPMLSYEDGVAAMDWLCKVFGFSEVTRVVNAEGILVHGQITMGHGVIMLASPSKDYQSPKHHRTVCETAAKWYQSQFIINGILVYIEDVAKHFENAKNLGATILSPLESGSPGLRYRAEDLEGQRWMFMQKD